jgi:hypothetical protein
VVGNPPILYEQCKGELEIRMSMYAMAMSRIASPTMTSQKRIPELTRQCLQRCNRTLQGWEQFEEECSNGGLRSGVPNLVNAVTCILFWEDLYQEVKVI